MRIVASALIGLLVCAVIGCGKKGNPRPPEDTAPSPVGSYSASGAVDAVVLRWISPNTTVEGDELRDLSLFVVQRSEYVKGQPAQFRKLAEVALHSDPNNRGYEYWDRDVKPGRSYEYVVVPVNSDGVEGASEQVLRVNFVGQSSRAEAL